MERFGVYVYGRGKSDDGQVERLSACAGLSSADATQVLVSAIPRRTSDHRDPAEAERVASEIRAAGFIALVVDLQELSSYRPLEVRGASFDESGVSFRPSGRFLPGALRLILHGRFTSSTEIRSEATVIDPRSGARVGSGSHQVRQEQGESFLHLYGADLSDAVELRANRFDFRCLGRDLAATRAGNLRAFLEKLQGLFPQALVDDTLLQHPLRARGESGYSFNAGVFVGSVEQWSTKASTEDTARRASLLMARARLGL